MDTGWNTHNARVAAITEAVYAAAGLTKDVQGVWRGNEHTLYIKMHHGAVVETDKHTAVQVITRRDAVAVVNPDGSLQEF